MLISGLEWLLFDLVVRGSGQLGLALLGDGSYPHGRGAEHAAPRALYVRSPHAVAPHTGNIVGARP